MAQERRIRQSELLQVILLDHLYAQSGSDQIVFQGGTALRWVYGGMRFSEDLEFVTHLTPKAIGSLLEKSLARTVRSCIAQFGPGSAERQIKGSRGSPYKVLFIYHPETRRERIAVRLEFERLQGDREPEFKRFVLRECPQVAGLIAGGHLFLPYSSSILLAETPEEILSDKIRALLETRYLKGRDIYDIWWLVDRMKVQPIWPVVKNKLSMYQTRFIPARRPEHLLSRKGSEEMIHAMDSDLARFLPQDIFALYREDNFRRFLQTIREVMSRLLDAGMRGDFEAQVR